MENTLEEAAGDGAGTRAFRISEPDCEGRRFIVALGPDGRDARPPAGETGRYAREGP